MLKIKVFSVIIAILSTSQPVVGSWSFSFFPFDENCPDGGLVFDFAGNGAHAYASIR